MSFEWGWVAIMFIVSLYFVNKKHDLKKL